MPLASGANTGISRVSEVTRGVTPGSPTMNALRLTGRNINPRRDAITSNERRSDRLKPLSRHGFTQVAGNFGYQLSCLAFDDMIEDAMSSAWASPGSTTGVDLGVVSGKINRATGSFLTDNIKPGLTIVLAGFTEGANNITTVVTDVTATDITVAATLTDEAAGPGKTVTGQGKVLTVGTTLKTATYERRFTDVSQYQVFRGVAVNQWSVSVQPNAIVTGAFELLGMSDAGLSGTSLGSPVAAAANEPLASFEGTIWADGAQLAVVTGIDFTLNNSRNLQAVIGSKFSPDVFEGDAVIGGTYNLLFEDETLYNKFNSEATSILVLKMTDINGTDFITFAFPVAKPMSADMDPPQAGPITLQTRFEAGPSATHGSSLIINESGAP